MESPQPKIALYGGTNECDMTNTLLLPLSEISTGAVSLAANSMSESEMLFLLTLK